MRLKKSDSFCYASQSVMNRLSEEPALTALNSGMTPLYMALKTGAPTIGPNSHPMPMKPNVLRPNTMKGSIPVVFAAHWSKSDWLRYAIPPAIAPAAVPIEHTRLMRLRVLRRARNRFHVRVFSDPATGEEDATVVALRRVVMMGKALDRFDPQYSTAVMGLFCCLKHACRVRRAVVDNCLSWLGFGCH